MLALSLQNESSSALVPGYRVAGKTGTAQIPTEYGYDPTIPMPPSSAGDPVDDPQFMIYVWLQEPSSSIWGSQTAAPVFFAGCRTDRHFAQHSARCGSQPIRITIMLTLADALEALTNYRPQATTVITEAVIDSRQTIPGSMFVAIPGEKTGRTRLPRRGVQEGGVFRFNPAGRGRFFPHPRPARRFIADSYPEHDFSIPLCLRVENTVTALQQIARFWRRKLDLRVIGITGSVGKSTTKEMVAEVLEPRATAR
jgi:hypothetical protein